MSNQTLARTIMAMAIAFLATLVNPEVTQAAESVERTLPTCGKSFYELVQEAEAAVRNEHPRYVAFFSASHNLHFGYLWSFIFGLPDGSQSASVALFTATCKFSAVVDGPSVTDLQPVPLSAIKDFGPNKAIQLLARLGYTDWDYIGLSFPKKSQPPTLSTSRYVLNIPPLNAYVYVPSGTIVIGPE